MGVICGERGWTEESDALGGCCAIFRQNQRVWSGSFRKFWLGYYLTRASPNVPWNSHHPSFSQSKASQESKRGGSRGRWRPWHQCGSLSWQRDKQAGGEAQEPPGQYQVSRQPLWTQSLFVGQSTGMYPSFLPVCWLCSSGYNGNG